MTTSQRPTPSHTFPYDNTYNKQDTNHHMNPQSNAKSNRQE